MDVIEYGLGKQRRAEVYVNRLLCYLLDPQQPHGMGTDFLDAVLSGLPPGLEFDEDTYDLSQVRVNEQVTIRDDPSADGPSRGYADLVIDVPNEWVLLVELKFSAAETGTKFYSRAKTFGDESVEDYESGQYLLYLHQRDQPEASSCEFTNWTWQEFLADVLTEFITEHALRYPQRTATQLHDLRDDLRSITDMKENSTTADEKIELYLDHVEAIEDVRQAFESAWETYSHDWDDELASSLDSSQLPVAREPGEVYPEVRIQRGGDETERWVFRANGGDWQHLFKYGWYRHESDLERLPKRADDRNDLRVGFYHRMEDERDTAIQDHQLKFNFRNMGSNPTDFIDIYVSEFDSRADDIEEHLTGTEAQLTGNKRTLIRGTYEIPVANHERFLDAYTAALQSAFVDLVVESPDLIRILSESYQDAVETFADAT
jgi:hypothetical protein